MTAVRDVMTTDVISFTREESVTDAMKRLLDAGVSGGPVVDGDSKVVGMLTDSDLIVQDAQLHAPTAIAILGVVVALPGSKREFEEDLHKQLGLTVGEVMGDEPFTISADAPVEDAATMMHDKDVSRLAVVDADERLVGVIARGDILRYIVSGRGDS
ncbi:MAG TPA: CBS domain-containing protein [Acidimicrobiales bacterium]|nr:CBS domain-containing protein [Acidimicrobiales bacterium]